MAARRARFGLANALAWVGFSLAATALVTDAIARDGGSFALPFGVAAATAGAALGLLTPAAVPMRTRLIVAGSLALLASAGGGALALLQQPPQLAIVVALGIAAGVHTSAISVAAAADTTLAPRVRPAPTLLAAAVGASLMAVAGLLPADGTAIALIAAACLQLFVIALAVAAVTAEPEIASADGPRAAARDRAPIAPPALLILLAIAAAGAGALAALRPSLSTIGADDPSPAGPVAITLAIGALLGPPLAMLADRVGAEAAAALAVVGGGAALIAPIARPGVLDLIAAVILGVALAAAVALAELARRAEQRLAAGATALLVLAGAAGAGIAGLLLTAVPVPDVVLGAAMTCLVAGVGMWTPGVRARQRVS